MTNRERYEKIQREASTRNEIHAAENADQTTRLDRRAPYRHLTPRDFGDWLKSYETSLEYLNDTQPE